jgi:hypothetical protein
MHAMRMAALVILAATTTSGARYVSAEPKGERVTVTGEALDLWCYVEAGDRGPAKRQCATMCAKAGNPIALLDAQGNIYLTASLKSHQSAQALLADKMNEEVTVAGTLVRKNGIQMIYIDTIR